jgi:predicted GIY-YIG superfamily endonuclease
VTRRGGGAKKYVLRIYFKKPSREEAMQREKYLKSLRGNLERKLNIHFEN